MAEALRDDDANFIPDRLGATVTLVGVITSDPVLLGPSAARSTLQDHTAGIPVFTRNPTLLIDKFKSGDRVQIRGEIAQYQGSEELVPKEILRLGTGAIPPPRDILAVDLRSERYSGQLVRLEGRLQVPQDLTRNPVLRDRSGEVPLSIPNPFLQSPRFTSQLVQGAKVQVIGIAGQRKKEGPFDSGYLLLPRTPSDFSFAPVVPVRTIALTLVLFLCSGLALLFWSRHRTAKRHSLKLQDHLHALARGQAALRASQNRLRAIIETMPESVKLVSADGALVEINPAGLAMIEAQRPSDAAGRSVYSLVAPECREDFRAFAQSVFQGRKGTLEFEIVGLKGTRRWVETHAVLLGDADEKPLLLAVMRDITTRKAATESLLKSNLLCQLVARAICDAVWDWDLTTNEVAWNENVLTLFGYSPDQVGSDVGWWEQNIHPDDRRRVLSGIRALLAAGQQFWTDEHRFRCADSSYAFVLARAFLIRDDKGTPVRIVGAIIDLTGRHLMEQALRESELIFRSFVETTSDWVWAIDSQGRMTYNNPGIQTILGHSPEELIGKDCFAFVHPDDRQNCENVFAQALANKSGWTGVVLRWRHKDGGCRYLESNAQPILSPTGELLGFRGADRHITDRVLVQSALQEREEQFRQLFEDAPVAYHELDRQGIVQRANRAECEMLGLEPAEILGKPIWHFVAPEQQESSQRAVLLKLAGEQPLVPFQRDYLRKDGTRLTVEIRENLIQDTDGVILGIRTAMSDVTARSRVEEALQTAKDAAEIASRAKSEFLANTSHELRTPLTGIMGMTDLVLDTELTPDQRECLTAVKSSANSLLAVLNEVLDFSKIEAGKLRLDALPFSLRDTVAASLNTLAVRAHQKELEFALQVYPDVPDDLVGDPGRLRQVLLNLAGNAVKFTERGEVVVSVQAEWRAEDETYLHFLVADTGIGIPTEKQASIFEPFAQIDSSHTRKYGGTGLGLAISSSLVAMMGGRLWVDSELGQGTTFHFLINVGLQQPEQQRLLPANLSNLQGLPVLVVVTNAALQRILTETLTAWNMQPAVFDAADAALTALQLAKHRAAPFRLVLIDLPRLHTDRLILAERIVKDPLLRTPTIVLTTTTAHSFVSRSEHLGIALLPKPFTDFNLRDTITRTLYAQTTDSPSPVSPAFSTGQTPRHLRILLAEDNPLNQIVIVRLLEKRGHTVTPVHNGAEAVLALEDEPYDVVLMDLQMPEMDGFAATAAIRNRDRTTGRHTHIVAVTAHAMTGDRERCLKAGMDDYISKPVDPQQLFNSVENPVPLSQQEHASPLGSTNLGSR